MESVNKDSEGFNCPDSGQVNKDHTDNKTEGTPKPPPKMEEVVASLLQGIHEMNSNSKKQQENDDRASLNLQATLNRSFFAISNQLASFKPNKERGIKLNPINSILEKLNVPGYDFSDEEISNSDEVSSKQPTLITKEFSTPSAFLKAIKNVSTDQSGQELLLQDKALGKQKVGEGSSKYTPPMKHPEILPSNIQPIRA